MSVDRRTRPDEKCPTAITCKSMPRRKNAAKQLGEGLLFLERGIEAEEESRTVLMPEASIFQAATGEQGDCDWRRSCRFFWRNHMR